jgi:hypothetical protein
MTLGFLTVYNNYQSKSLITVQYTAQFVEFCLCLFIPTFLQRYFLLFWFSDSIDYNSENFKIFRFYGTKISEGFLLFLTVPCEAGCHAYYKTSGLHQK